MNEKEVSPSEGSKHDFDPGVCYIVKPTESAIPYLARTSRELLDWSGYPSPVTIVWIRYQVTREDGAIIAFFTYPYVEGNAHMTIIGSQIRISGTYFELALAPGRYRQSGYISYTAGSDPQPRTRGPIDLQDFDVR
jgi:hypothetical protein